MTVHFLLTIRKNYRYLKSRQWRLHNFNVNFRCRRVDLELNICFSERVVTEKSNEVKNWLEDINWRNRRIFKEIRSRNEELRDFEEIEELEELEVIWRNSKIFDQKRLEKYFEDIEDSVKDFKWRQLQGPKTKWRLEEKKPEEVSTNKKWFLT